MAAQATKRFFLYLLLILGAFTSGLSAKSALITAENSEFKIVGLHAQSVSYVEELSQYIIQIAERSLGRNAFKFPQSILVSLKPDEFAEFEADYQIRIGDRGSVNLDLRWEKDLSLRTTCLALADALFVHYSIWKNGVNGPSLLPAWPASAIGTSAYLSLRPAESMRLGDWINPAATPNLESLLTRKWGMPIVDANGYALLMVMKAGGIQRADIRKLMAQSIAGVNIAPAIKAITEPDASPDSEQGVAVGWWQGVLERLKQTDQGIIDSMQVSRDWLQTLSDLSGVDGEGTNLVSLWDQRQDAGIRELIEARYEILLFRIPTVNPAYFNAARTLGTLFEGFLREDSQRHRHMHRVAAFLGDFEDAKDLEDLVYENLTAPEGE